MKLRCNLDIVFIKLKFSRIINGYITDTDEMKKNIYWIYLNFLNFRALGLHENKRDAKKAFWCVKINGCAK